MAKYSLSNSLFVSLRSHLGEVRQNRVLLFLGDLLRHWLDPVHSGELAQQDLSAQRRRQRRQWSTSGSRGGRTKSPKELVNNTTTMTTTTTTTEYLTTSPQSVSIKTYIDRSNFLLLVVSYYL